MGIAYVIPVVLGTEKVSPDDVGFPPQIPWTLGELVALSGAPSRVQRICPNSTYTRIWILIWRAFGPPAGVLGTCQLVCFCDASPKAFRIPFEYQPPLGFPLNTNQKGGGGAPSKKQQHTWTSCFGGPGAPGKAEENSASRRRGWSERGLGSWHPPTKGNFLASAQQGMRE